MLKHKPVTESNGTSLRVQNEVVKRAPMVRSVRLNNCVRGLLIPTIDISVDDSTGLFRSHDYNGEKSCPHLREVKDQTRQ